MTLKTRNGKLLLKDGKLVTGPCSCCEAQETCCYSADCRVVPCDSPDVIGAVAGCDPCQLNFCGFCPPTLPTSVPLDVTDTPGPLQISDNQNNDIHPICAYVFPESIEISLNSSGVARGRDSGTASAFLFVNARVVHGPIALLLSGNTGGSDRVRIGFGTTVFHNNMLPAIQQERRTVVLDNTFNSTDVLYSISGTIRADGFSQTPYDSNCQSNITYTIHSDIEVIVDMLDGTNVGTESESSSQEVSVAYSPADCDGEIIVERNITGASTDPGTELNIQVNHQQFTQTLPTCSN